jgi:hypothetical protein
MALVKGMRMPSIADVANDIKGLLDDVKNNTNQTNVEINTLNSEVNTLIGKVDTLIGVDQIGFANLSSGLGVVIDRLQEANHLLDANRRQNDTIICWLTNIANVGCEQLRVLQAQAALQRSMDAHLGRLESIAHLVHAREYVQVLENEATNARIDACCPPETPDPGPCFEACPSPRYRPFEHSDVTFTPLPIPQHD